MVKAKHIELIGNQFKIAYDDGTYSYAVPTQGTVWLVGGVQGGGGENPNPGNGKFIWPFDPNVYVTSEYGPREGGTGSFHEGIDLAPSRGTPIPVSGDGVVEENYYHSNFGNLCIVFHGTINGKDIRTLYPHRENLDRNVGDVLKKGDIVGTVGDTGFSFGAHLHWETHVCEIGQGITWNTSNNGGYRTAINPRDFMATYGEAA